LQHLDDQSQTESVTSVRAAREDSPLRFASPEFENNPQIWLDELESEILAAELEMLPQDNRKNHKTEKRVSKNFQGKSGSGKSNIDASRH
jgi:hypothetical protein